MYACAVDGMLIELRDQGTRLGVLSALKWFRFWHLSSRTHLSHNLNIFGTTSFIHFAPKKTVSMLQNRFTTRS